MEEAEKRDHRRLGRSLDLFHFQDEAPGLIFWHAKGWTIWQQVEQYMRRVYQENGYQEVKGPQILDRSLWEKSGHWDNYKENMFTTESENRIYALKPMNCPGHVQIYRSNLHSYRELPLRYGEFGQCHRNEPSGSSHGMMRVRGFTQDDGHIFCTEDQILDECVAFTDLLKKVYRDFGFTDFIYKIATRPEKRVGSDEAWDKAENALIQSLERSGCSYEVSPGEGAFYGPKIEYTLKDYDGVSAKGGNPPVISIVYSTQHIEKSANESLYKLDFETRGVLYHELVHAYQFEPKGIGSYSTNKTFWACIEGLADAVRAQAGYFDMSTRKPGGNWMDGYRTTGFFIQWLTTKDPDAIRKFHETVRDLDEWSFDKAMKRMFGEDASIEGLWNEYQAFLSK